MVKVAVMLAQGFEEIEALTVVDVLRRANITCDMVGFEEQVTGSHAIQVTAYRVFDGDLSDYDMIVLPGGMPGSAHLRDNQALIQELQSVEQEGKKVFFFSADWCGDCRYIQPFLPEIEAENPEFTFILVDRDQYLDLAKLWDIYGIPSLVVLDKDRELGRFVNRDRKTKAQISEFLAGLK